MGRSCVVPYCTSGYRSNKEKISTFVIPEKNLNEFQKAIARKDRNLTTKDYICAKHFTQDQIVTKVETPCYSYVLQVPKLAKNAIPSIFPGHPKDLNGVKKKNKIIQKHDLAKKKSKINIAISDANNAVNELKSRSKFNNSFLNILFKYIWDNHSNFNLPNKSWGIHLISTNNSELRRICIEKVIAMEENIVHNKTIVLRCDSTKISVETMIFGVRITIDEVKEIDTLNKFQLFLDFFENLKLCFGGEKYNEHSLYNNKHYNVDHSLKVWRHTKCPYIISSGNKCNFCKKK